jgi:hypothetical protein
MDTEMQGEIRERCMDLGMREFFVQHHRDGKLIAPDHSAGRMVEVLDKLSAGGYESGAHIDINDIEADAEEGAKK